MIVTGFTVDGERARIVKGDVRKGEIGEIEFNIVPLNQLKEKLTGTVTTAMSGRGTTFRIIELPFKQRKKILQVLPSELEDSIPFPLEDVVYDFQVWEKGKTGSTILVSIVKKEEYESLVSKLKELKIYPTRVGVEALYLSPLFQFVSEKEEIGILDIEADHSNLLLWGGGKKFFPRYLATGGKVLKQMVEEEGERSSKVVEDYLKLLSVEIKQSVYSFRNQTGQEVKKLYVTGSYFEPEEMDILYKITGIKSEVLKTGIFPPMPPDLKEQEFHLPLACALNTPKSPFFSSTDFSLPAEESEKEWGELKKKLTITLVLYLLLLTLSLVSIIVSYSHVHSRYMKVKEEELKIISETIPNTPIYYDYVDTLKDKVEEIKKLALSRKENSNFARIDILKNISAAIPQGTTITITDLTIDGVNVTIRGKTSDFSALDKIRSAIGSAKGLTNVAIVDSKKMPKSGEVVFTITAKIKGEDEK